MAKSYQHVYLSPHFDDAALSCGGTIHQQVQAREDVLVITIYAASPATDAPLSPFAESLHEAWHNPTDVVAARRAEDAAAMGVLGCDYHYLDLPDCIYRGDVGARHWFYNSDDELFGTIHPTDLTLASDIAETVAILIADSPDCLICAPLAVGHHVDHQLTYMAAEQLRQQGRQVIFYEDYPYSDLDYPVTRSSQDEKNLYTLAATLAAKEALHLQPHLRSLSAENMQAKIESIRAYGSQLAMLFGGTAAMEAAIHAYFLSVGEDQPAERVWHPR